MMISLIVATVGRVDELERLLTSLDRQTFTDFEVIVVDQNPDDRLVPVLRRHGLTLRHLRSKLGVSRARNAGLRVAQGEIVAVPDDDCWYPSDLLSTVTEWFKAHPEFDVLLAGPRNENDELMVSRLAPGPGPCTKESVWHCATAITAFLRMAVTKAVGFYDETIGPGTRSKYRSGEDIDYLIRAIVLGFQAWYEPSLTVYHREFRRIGNLRRVSYGYSLGVGYLLRVHGYSWHYFGKVLFRSLGGAVVYFCRGDLSRSLSYLQRAAGQFQGYVFCPNERRNLAESSPR